MAGLSLVVSVLIATACVPNAVHAQCETSAGATKKDASTICAGESCAASECCNKAKCADSTRPPSMKMVSSPPTDCLGESDASCTNCYEDDDTKCGHMSASDICDPNQLILMANADVVAGADDAAKKTNCCSVGTCDVLGVLAANPVLTCPSDKPVWDDVITTALPETTDADKYESAKTTCCIAAPTCASITCGTGYTKKASPPTDCAASRKTLCAYMSCCEAEPAADVSAMCVSATVTCDGDQVKGNLDATAGTGDAIKTNCCVDKGTCGKWEEDAAAAAAVSTARGNQIALATLAAVVAIPYAVAA